MLSCLKNPDEPFVAALNAQRNTSILRFLLRDALSIRFESKSETGAQVAYTAILPVTSK